MRKTRPVLRQAGQMILILILVMTVALGIGLSVIQKSLVDISTASKVEQSSRAFSAAEAGVEKALHGNTGGQTFTDTSSGFQNVSDSGLIPCVPGQYPCAQGVGSRQLALEYPPLAKEDVVQVWLADPGAGLPACASLSVCYSQPTLDIYWGNSATDMAAIELTLVYYDGATFQSRKWYLDWTSRSSSNGFDAVLCGGNYSPPGSSTSYQCYKRLGDSTGVNNGSLPSGLMLMRARLLYNTTSQPLAVQATGTCGIGCSLPPQARQIISTGVSGQTQRTVKLFQMNKVVPQLFDYALFSAGEINK